MLARERDRVYNTTDVFNPMYCTYNFVLDNHVLIPVSTTQRVGNFLGDAA